MANELLTPNFWSINQLFKYRFTVPVYQRPYSWQTPEVDSMLSDIWESYESYLKMSDDEKQKNCLYVGNIILHRKAFEQYDIIDGQQRITTFSIFLLALYGKCFELGVDPNNRILIKIQSALWKLDVSEKPVQNKRVIELGSIEKQIMLELFNEAYSQPKSLKKFVDSYTTKSVFEKNVKDNFNRVYGFAKAKFVTSESQLNDILQFANYILSKVFLIAIINEDSEFKAFSIFESINSKGKKLEDIDLIKTKIFASLKESDYLSYLSKWGKLIVDTNDKLYDFLKIYIKADIKYYTANITYNQFGNMDNILCSYFKKSTIDEAYKALIEDMVEKIDCFNAVSNLKTATSLISNNKFKFYYSIFTKLNYEHPKPLFFRCFCEYKNGNLSKSDLIDIIIDVIKFSVTFLTVCGRESKDAISMFESIANGIYNSNKVDKSWILYQINNKMTAVGIRKEEILASLEHLDVFEKNKQLGAAVLSTYESQYPSGSGTTISWDEAYSKFSTYGDSYTLDHIMVQTPSIDDSNLKYYKLGNNLQLKQGHDFPSELVYDGMEYDNFKNLILHRAGNLRLKGGDGNSSHGNKSEESFSTYQQLDARNKEVCEFFVNNVINIDPSPNNFDKNIIPSPNKTKMYGNFLLSQDLDLTGTKPQSVTIGGKTTKISTLKEILELTVSYVFGLDKEKLFKLAKDNWAPAKRVILTNDKMKLHAPYEFLGNEIYAETNLSARDIIRYSAKLLDEFYADKNTISIYIPE